MKMERLARILDVIERHSVHTQEELADLLGEQGIVVTQATVSRDIKELRLIKVLGEDGAYQYASVGKAESNLTDRFIRIFNESIVSINAAENIIVIKTLTGTASAAAEAIDSMKWIEVIGTMAGDNTIMVVVSCAAVVPDVIRRFKNMVK